MPKNMNELECSQLADIKELESRLRVVERASVRRLKDVNKLVTRQWWYNILFALSILLLATQI